MDAESVTKAIILAGGKGSRLAEETVVRPKPLVEIGGRPIIWHILNIYSWHGCKEFVVALGYKGEMLKQYFLDYYSLNSHVTVDLSSGKAVVYHDYLSARPEWKLHLIDTGLHTQTGGRIKRLRRWVGDGPFMLTYGDAVADVDIRKLIDFHVSSGRLATVTAVRPPARFGGLDLEGDRVARFTEKPQSGEGWINGGFFVLNPQVFDYISDDATIWERDPLERLALDGELAAYRHYGFWQAMDTIRDREVLENLWATGKAPWKVWP